MTTPITNSLRWDVAQGRLSIDEALLETLTWPHLLKLERGADGLILTVWDSQATAKGQFVCSISYDDEQNDLPSLVLIGGQAETLGLQQGTYTAWASSWDDCIYVIPRTMAAQAPSSLVALTKIAITQRTEGDRSQDRTVIAEQRGEGVIALRKPY